MGSRKAFNTAILHEPAFLEEILGRIVEAVFVIDKEGNFLYANRAAYEERGYTQQEFLKLNARDINLPERAGFVRDKLKEVIKTGQATFETIHVRKDGSTLPVEITSRVFESSGRKGMIAVARDMTERKQAEERERTEHELLISVINSTNAVVFTLDIKGRYTAFNKAHMEAMKRSYGTEIKIGENIFDFISDDIERRHGRACFQRVLKGERFSEETIYGKSEEGAVYFDISYSPILDNGGKVAGSSVFARDITERKRAEAELAEMNARLESTLRAIPDLMFEVDTKGRIHDYHAPANELLYVPPEAFLGKKVDEVLPREAAETCQKAIDRAAAKGWFRGATYKLDLPRGPRWFELSIDVKSRIDGKADRLLVISRDVTDSFLAEEAVKRERDAAQMYLDIVNTIVIAINKTGRVIMINKFGANLLGYSEEEIVGQPWFDNFVPFHERKLVKKAFSDIIAGNMEGTREFENVVLCRNGEEKLILWRNDYVKDPKGEFLFTLSAGEDVTEKYEARYELRENYAHLEEVINGIIKALSTTVETRDPYTAGHQRRVEQLAVAIAKTMGWEKKKIDGLSMASTIHDIGKMYVPAEVLNKPGKLEPVEFELIKLHSAAGYEIVKDISFDEPVAAMVRQHHERLDGSGYPDGLLAKDILPGAKIMAVADVVEAMSSDRPYRPGRGLTAALREVQDRKDELYDPKAVDACVKLFAEEKFKFD